MNRHTQKARHFQEKRDRMVDQQIAGRGIDDPRLLHAIARVPRELFLPESLQEFAYDDVPLPLSEGQTISQPWIVAHMIDALALKGGERVLEIGTGSGYAAAILAEIAGKVFALERLSTLAEQASRRLNDLGYGNVEVIRADGSRGWERNAPYDAILVSAAGPEVPQALKTQLAPGGRLVMPVGNRERQQLRKLTRTEDDAYREEALSHVHFVPLVGESGWKHAGETSESRGDNPAPDLSPGDIEPDTDAGTARLIARAAHPLQDPTTDSLDPLLDAIGDARVVLIGEASHGTAEFYRFRARITRELITRKGFDMVAVEADWPDAARIDHYVRDLSTPPSEWRAFTRFPTWMWRNTEVQDFVEWLRQFNSHYPREADRVGFHGLDLYSLFTSIDEVLKYLDSVDPAAAAVARERYGCLTPWQSDPATYGRAALTGRYRECAPEVVATLVELIEHRLEYAARDGDNFMDAVQNARLVANAEEYYRSMYLGYADSWNLRDSHMFDTLCSLLEFRGSNSKIVVWEHNSHIGDASVTDMAARGQHNVGQLCRDEFGNDAYLIGFGTHTGTVAAADDWGGPMRVKQVRPSLEGSWERLCHDSGVPAFILDLHQSHQPELQRRLVEERPQRAIGVIYRPETEWASHYFRARLGRQFDSYVWLDQTSAVTPLDTREMKGMPDTYPFGL